MHAISDDQGLDLQVVVTGAHLEKRFGLTYRAIQDDGIKIDRCIPCGLTDDSPATIAAAIGKIVTGMTGALENLKPDIVVVLGDRYEILAVAQACMISRVPIAHISGGERTEGAIDDVIRHATTKMAHLHLPSTKAYRQRIIQLGEHPDTVFNTGALGTDAIANFDCMDIGELSEDVGRDLAARPYLLMTYHPMTLDDDVSIRGAIELTHALEAVPQFDVLMTGVNGDPGSSTISALLHDFADNNTSRVLVIENLGHRRYLSAMAHTACVIGNSSSGIAEAPAMGVPSINIGDRQLGRIRAPSVIDVANEKDAIIEAIKLATSPAFRKLAGKKESPYGPPGVAERMTSILKTVNLDGILVKSFYDIETAL
jgi:UDP-hydrolysing UDP-N-acetyl-D-glucosamine 2-epimerase